MLSETYDADDLGEAIREGRALHPGHAYRILVSDATLTFHAVHVADPLPLGRQILDAAEARPVDEFSLFALLPSGDFEDVRLDEPFDLRGHGAERFVFFRTDRSFKFMIDNRQLDWGKPLITGMVLRRLANIQPGYALYLEVRGGQDREIGDADVVDLSQQGIERFITVIRETTEGLIALPTMDQSYLDLGSPLNRSAYTGALREGDGISVASVALCSISDLLPKSVRAGMLVPHHTRLLRLSGDARSR